MRSALAALGTGALGTALAAAAVWALTGTPPAIAAAPGAAVVGQGWELSAVTLATAGSGPDGPAPDGTRYVLLGFELAARAPLDPDQLGCSVEFRAGGLTWRPDNAALPLGGAAGCYGLQPGANRLAYSVTVPSGIADDVVAEVTVSPAGGEPGWRWFGGDALVRVAR